MTRSLSKLYPVAALAAVLALGACNRQAGDAAPAADAPSTAPVAPAAPVSTVLKVAEVKFGRYVEPKTFAVGGVGKKFKTSDQLFASVQLDGVADTASVQVRLLDAAGQVVADQSRDIQPKKPMKVNFQLTKGLAAPLTAGTYRVETNLNGQSAMADELTIE